MHRKTIPAVKPLTMLRFERNVSQAELASVLGVTPATISNWETGRTNINLLDAYRYAAALGQQLNLTFTPVEDEAPVLIPDDEEEFPNFNFAD